MTGRTLSAIVAALLAATSAAAQSSTVRRNAGPGYDESVGPHGQVARSDNTGKGAVLCAWGVLEAARAAGESCAADRDGEFRARLASELARVDRFIVVNSSRPVTPADLAARRAAGVEQLKRVGPVCSGDAARIYGALRDRGAASLHAYVDDLLSIPREPVMNPCL